MSKTLPEPHTLAEAFDHDIYASSGNPVKFGSLYYDCDVYPAEKRILVIFIRHFFCGNCQEYVRRISAPDSPFHPSHKSTPTTWTTNFSKPASRTLPTLVIIGPGQPSLIASYKALTQCPFDIYADPSTQLYSILGMHRTLSMGNKTPGYIEHSLLSGAVKSAWQIVRRVGSGDAMAGGNWDVNGGEFLFVRSANKSRAGSRSPSQSRSGSRSRSAHSRASNKLEWEVFWCHRMANSRDHTELLDLAFRTCFTTQSSTPTDANGRTDSPAPPLKSILVNKSHIRAVSRSYSSERFGACPGPDVPKSRTEIQASSHSSTHSRSQSNSKSPRRSRSRSTSTSSRTTAKQNHDRIWSNVSSVEASRSESYISNTVTREIVVNPISEAGEDEIKPRKSFSASVADALGVRTMLKRSKSISGSSAPVDDEPAMPRTSTSLSDLSAASRAGSGTNTTKLRSKSIIKPISLLRTKSHSKEASTEATPSDSATAEAPMTTYERNRTLSSSSKPPTQRHKPSLSLTRKSSRNTEMDENGVMCVDGVEFVNVISVKARVEVTEEEQRRRRLRDRADSGLGMMATGTEDDALNSGPPESLPPIPASMPSPPKGQDQKKFFALTALPKTGIVH